MLEILLVCYNTVIRTLFVPTLLPRGVYESASGGARQTFTAVKGQPGG